MARRGSHGFGEQPYKEKEPGEGAEVEGRRDGDFQMGENSRVGNLDCWTLSSSQEMLEDEELLRELKDYQHLLEEGEQGFDLGELQDLERAGDVNATSPLPEEKGSPEDLGLRAYLQLDRRREEDNTQLEKTRGMWDFSSQEDVHPELSFEGQYGSDFSPSPEALQEPLALYKCSFASDNVDDELSESSHLSPSPCGPPPMCTQLEIEPQILDEDGLDFPEDRKFSWESGRTPDSHGHSSLASSLQYNQRLLDFQSLEDLQNCPGIDAETCPELSWMENLEQPLEKEPQTIQQLAFNDTEERLLGSRETTQMSHPFKRVGSQLEKRARKLKADVPRGLLSKGPRQSRSLSPRRITSQKKPGPPASKAPDRETPSNSGARDVTQYGRGKLNYPLPDLSKVEPRVKFPKDPQSYQPPQGKTSPASRKEVRKPVIFKSPAEIVREVLLSSGEGSPHKCPTPTISVIPEELKSPRQATELVHQLQEDYHKLLTKYAEAENTIDRLRLSAKVRLYSDPPKPSQAAEMGRISEASKVVTFSIPQIRSAEMAKQPSQASRSGQGEGFPRHQPQHPSLTNSTGIASSETDRPISSKAPFLGDHLTQLLAAQASKFQTQMEFLEGLIQTDRLEAMEQLKGFARLKEAQEALEQAYLQARNKYQQLNQNGAMETLGEFDPNRAVEGNIFHLGLRLEGMKERIELSTWNQQVGAKISPRSVPSHPIFPVQLSEEQMGTPTPSLHAPVPAVCIPYPEASTPKNNTSQAQLEADLSSISDGAGEEEEEDFLELPQPCKPQEEEEEDMDYLLDQCSSFRSLPEVLSHKHNAEELGSEATAAAGTKGGSLQKPPASNKTPPASKGLQEKEAPERSLRKVQQPTHPSRQVSSIQAEGALGEPAEIDRPTVAVRKMFSRRQQAGVSPHSSMASVRGSIASEPAAPHSPQKMDATLCEDLRIVSPETDSGFVGSETSRASPLAPMPKHQLAKRRSYSIQRPSSTMEVPPCSPSSKKAPGVVKHLGPDKSPGQVKPETGRSRGTLTKRKTPQKTSPCRWTNEMEPEDNENFHPDSESETETHAGTSLDGSPPARGRGCPSSSPISSNMAQARHKNFLHSRLERDEAIEALQHEVSRLRQSLEESLHRQSSSPHPSRVQDTAHRYPSVTPARTSRKSGVESDGSFLAAEPKGRTQKASLAQHGSELDFNPSESDGDAPSKLQDGKHHTTSRIRPSKQRTVQGPYTGTQYPISAPESQDPKRLQTSPLGHPSVQLPRGEEDSAGHLDGKDTRGSCGSPLRDTGSPNDGSRPSKQRATEGWLCPLCKDSSNSRNKDIAGAGDRKEDAPEESSRTQPKFHQHQQPKQAGLWYLAVPSTATSLNYIPAIPLAQYPVSSLVYSPPPVTTSIYSSVALPAYVSTREQTSEWKTSRHRLREYHCCSRTFFPSASLEDLNWTLNRAVEAAKDMKFTTEQMNKSLSWALRKARSPRASCLF